MVYRMSRHQKAYTRFIRKHPGSKPDRVVHYCTTNPKADPHAVEAQVISGLNGLIRNNLLYYRGGRLYLKPSKPWTLKQRAMLDAITILRPNVDIDTRDRLRSVKRAILEVPENKKGPFIKEPSYETPGKVFRPVVPKNVECTGERSPDFKHLFTCIYCNRAPDGKE